jgi:hypothetical protein
VSRITDQEGAALAEMGRHPVMDMIGRKPVHFLDIDLQVLDRPIADVIECECTIRVPISRMICACCCASASPP